MKKGSSIPRLIYVFRLLEYPVTSQNVDKIPGPGRSDPGPDREPSVPLMDYGATY